MTAMTQNTTTTTNTPPPDLCNRLNAEWRKRPHDQRFLSLDDLHQYCLDRANRCKTEVTNARRIKATATPMTDDSPDVEFGDNTEADRHFALLFETEAGVVDATHWAFGQLMTTIKTPSPYIRRVDPRLAEKLIDYGLTYLADRSEHALYVEEIPERGELARLRAFTSKGFGRIYDHEVVDMVRDVADPDVWRPPIHSYSGGQGTKKATTLYGSDRDIAIFLVDDQHPIEIKVDGQRETLARGFVVRNSEVGSSRMSVTMFFYRYDCDNRLVWTPRSMREIGITHTSGAPERFRREAAPMLARFASANVDEVRQRVEAAMRLEVGRDKESVTDWLHRRGFGKTESRKMYDRAVEEEGKARTVWDLIQGGTALARGIQHTDVRLQKEARVSKMLERVA